MRVALVACNSPGGLDPRRLVVLAVKVGGPPVAHTGGRPYKRLPLAGGEQ